MAWNGMKWHGMAWTLRVFGFLWTLEVLISAPSQYLHRPRHQVSPPSSSIERPSDLFLGHYGRKFLKDRQLMHINASDTVTELPACEVVDCRFLSRRFLFATIDDMQLRIFESNSNSLRAIDCTRKERFSESELLESKPFPVQVWDSCCTDVYSILYTVSRHV